MRPHIGKIQKRVNATCSNACWLRAVCRESCGNLRDCFHLDQRSRRASSQRFPSRLPHPREAKALLSAGWRVHRSHFSRNFFRHKRWLDQRCACWSLQLNRTVNRWPDWPPPTGTDRRGHLRIARFVCSHSTCAKLVTMMLSDPCSYRCGYPAYRYYPTYRHRCYSCGPAPHL